MKKLLALGLSLLMCVSLVGCGGNGGNGEVSDGGTYIIAQQGEPASLNPDTNSDDYLYAIAQNMFNRLVKLNNNYEVLPDLATDWEISDDALTYTFNLNKKAEWWDGEPVTADDVKYTFDTIVSKSYANASVFANVESIEAKDEHTVVFHMATADATFLSNVAWYGTFILPQHELEGTDWTTSDFNENPLGSGPFKFSKWNKGTDVRLVKNEKYWGDVPHLDELVYTVIPDTNTAYQAWLNDEVDEIASANIPTSEIESLKETGNYVWVEQEWPSPYYVTFNLNDGPFKDVKVRKAAAMGIDRDEVSKKAFNGYKPANNYYISQIYKSSLNEEAKQPDYDPKGAMKLIEEAGYKKNSDGYYFETTLTIFEGFEDAATVVTANLEKIGIKCSLNVIDYNVWEETVWKNQKFDFTMVAGFQGPDVLGAGRRWTTNGVVNVNNYSNAEVDKLYNQALAASSQEEIDDCMKKIQAILAEDITLVTMVNYTDVAAFKNYVHGHPMYTNDQGGSRDKAGFSEMTYVWVDNAE